MATALPNPFVPASMVSMSKLAPERPVYKIDYLLDPRTVASFVIKGEGRKHATTDSNAKATPVARHNQQNSLQTSIMLMRDAARGGRGRVLNDREAGGFRSRALLLLASDLVADFTAAFDSQSLWMLLGLKEGLVDLEGIVKGANALKARQILLALRDPENLDRLGRILATDMFLGNTDRFVNDVGGKGIQNIGNVFFVEKGTGEFKIKGLDVFDPSKNTALMSHTVARGCTDPRGGDNVDYWAGPLLKDPVQLNRVAQNALDSLYTELSGVLRKANEPAAMIRGYDFTDQHTRRVVAGMNAALIVIKASCKQRLAQMRKGKADTAGLKSRMKLMNWST
ncbi:MAG: hypothetical protein ACYC2G_17115 [Gemmatimonadaceae bacterium]